MDQGEKLEWKSASLKKKHWNKRKKWKTETSGRKKDKYLKEKKKWDG